MNDRLSFLLRLYLEKRATDEHREELRALIRSNRFDHVIKDDITNFLTNEFQHSKQDTINEVDADKLFERILSNGKQPVKVVQMPSRRNWIWAAAAILFIGIGVAWLGIGKWQRDNEVAQSAKSEEVFRFSSKDYIHLPDGSTVLLNEGSELTYSKSYGKKLREVTLTGEAYFDIKKNPEQAFIVHTGKVQTRVLGTAFNINARNDQVIVTVTRGLVEVGDDNKTYGRIKPDEQITVNTVSYDFALAEVKAESELKWKKQTLIFDEISFEETARLIEERFGVKVAIENEAIKKCRISAWFLSDEDLNHVLELISGTRQASYTLKDKKVTITGGIGCE